MSASDDMHVFSRVIERGSFSAAAEELGITASGVSRVVSRLEDRLGVRLLHRTTRRLSLTFEGETYYQRAKEILAAIDDAELEVSLGGNTPQGRLRVSSVVPFAHHCIAEALPEFTARYPKIAVEIMATDRIIDLLADGVDVAIRSGQINDLSLVARKIGDVERGIYVSPAYLARRGVPNSPEQLTEHDCIRLTSTPSGHRWPFFVDGQLKVIEIESRLSADNAIVALQIALAGGGMVRTSNLTIGAAVRDGRLVQVLTDCHVAEPTPLSVVYPLGRHRMPKVRAFIDFLIERFSHAPWRNAREVDPA